MVNFFLDTGKGKLPQRWPQTDITMSTVASKVIDNAPNGVESVVSRFSKIWQTEVHSEYVIQRTARERIEFLTGQKSQDFCFLTFVLLWMRSGLGTELFAMNDWSYGGFLVPHLAHGCQCSPDCVLSVLQFLCVSRFLEHLSLSCNHTYPVLRLQSIRSHKTDTICVNSGPQVQNPCMKRTSSMTCNMTVHETKADCRKLWIRLVTQMFLNIKTVFPYLLSVWSRSMFQCIQKRFIDLLASTHSPTFKIRVERYVLSVFCFWSDHEIIVTEA